MRKALTVLMALTVLLIMAVAANAAVGTVIYCMKTDKAPNMEEIDDSWGEPAIYVTKDSPNAELAKYWTQYNDTAENKHSGTGPQGRTTIEPEDSDFWLYTVYDDENIYLAFKTPDYHISGSEEKHRGDGIHLWLQPLDMMTDVYGSCGHRAGMDSEERLALQNTYYFFWNLAFDDWSTDSGNACVNLEVKPMIDRSPRDGIRHMRAEMQLHGTSHAFRGFHGRGICGMAHMGQLDDGIFDETPEREHDDHVGSGKRHAGRSR